MEMELCYASASWDLTVLQLNVAYLKSLYYPQGILSFLREHKKKKTSGFECQKTHHFNVWIFSKKAVTGHRL